MIRQVWRAQGQTDSIIDIQRYHNRQVCGADWTHVEVMEGRCHVSAEVREGVAEEA